MAVELAEMTERVLAPWPLVGRSAVLARCLQALDGRRSVVVTGDAGIGKTRLAAEVRSDLERQGRTVRHLVASSATAAVPLGALTPLMADVPGPSELSTHALHDAMRQLALESAPRAATISVDDAHLLDDLSGALLRQLATAGEVSLLLTTRATEPAPPDVVALWKDGLAERIEVEPLQRSELLEAIEQVLGAPLDGPSANELWRLAGGNPLHARELLAAVADGGALCHGRRTWRLDAVPAGAQRLVEVVDHRLHQLGPPLREVMDLVAVADGAGRSLLASLGVTPELEALERRGLVTVATSGDRRPVRVAHPLHGEVLRAAMPSSRRAALRSRLAEAVLARGARRVDDPILLTTWALDDGVAVDPSLSLRAARTAFARHDHQGAERFARAVLSVAPSDDARWLLGLALEAQGRAVEADDLFASVDVTVLSDEDLLRHVVHRAENLYWLGRADDAHEVLRSVHPDSVAPSIAARLRTTAASFLLLDGVASTALDHLRPEGTDLDDWLRDPAMVADPGLTVTAPALVVVGRPATALHLVEAGIQQRSGVGDEQAVQDLGVLLAVRAFARTELGALAEAASDAHVGHQLALDRRLHEGQALFALYRGRAALARGHAELAVEAFDEAATLFGRTRLAAFERWSWAGKAWGLALLGAADDAAAVTAELIRPSPPAAGMIEPEIARALAAVAAATGEVDRARSYLDAASATAASSGAITHALAITHDLVRYGLAGPTELAVLDELARRVEGPLAAARRRHGRGLARADGAELLAASADLETCGALLIAAEAAADAVRTLVAGARGEAARGAAGRVDELRRQLGTASSPSLALPSLPTHLTPREREVAALTAAGHSTRDVADRLVVSPRTVENHLHRVYAKLGITGRTELAEALGITTS